MQVGMRERDCRKRYAGTVEGKGLLGKGCREGERERDSGGRDARREVGLSEKG